MDSVINTFLLRAKRATYASGIAPSGASRPHSKDFQYQEGPLLYIDTYLGDINFIGEEAVWQDDKAVWGMNYYGWMLVDPIPEGFSPCLKGALSNLPADAPYRGPHTFTLGEFSYRCSWEGSPACFRGEETITWKEDIIYQLYFHGGTVTHV